MYPFQIGVLLDSFRLETAAALDKAAELGVKGIQIYATKGEMFPESLTPAVIPQVVNRLGGVRLRHHHQIRRIQVHRNPGGMQPVQKKR